MIREENEYLAVLIALKDFTISLSSICSSITLEDIQEYLWSDIGSLVVNIATSIDIRSIWFVEELSLEWIFSVVGDIVISKNNDLILWDLVVL